MLMRQFKTQDGVEILCPICKSNKFEGKKGIVVVDNGMCDNTEETIVVLV
jgi:hypothetical protein